MDKPASITVELTSQEALVLYEYLRRCDDEGKYTFADQSEERVLWQLEGQLEKSISVIVDPNYRELLKAARAQVRDKE